jgi:hypothetical protein
MSFANELWGLYAANSDKVNPIVAGLGGAALVWAAIRQARTATNRPSEQTRADQQRRLTESFSKAVEQLASDKIEARLGGIYTLERLALEAIAQVKSPPWRTHLKVSGSALTGSLMPATGRWSTLPNRMVSCSRFRCQAARLRSGGGLLLLPIRPELLEVGQ